MKDRYLKQLIVCLSIINANIDVIQNIWNKEIENGGYLSHDICDSISNIHTITSMLLKKYKDIDWGKEHQSTVKNIYSFMTVNTSTKKQEGAYGYNYMKEKELLPNRLLDSTLSLSYTMNYLYNKLKLTVDRQGINKEIQELFDNCKSYVEFTEEELILTKYEV